MAAEKRFTQQRIADTLGLSRSAVVERFRGRVPFTATEVLTLAVAMGERIERFFPALDGFDSPTNTHGVSRLDGLGVQR